MTPFAVVEDLDVLEEAAVRGLVVEPATMVGQLGLEQMEERLSYSVVPTVTLAAHTLYETMLGDPLDEATAGVLDPTIRVDDQAPWGVVAEPRLAAAPSARACGPATNSAPNRPLVANTDR